MISVAIIKPDEALDLPWDDLRPFARNAFMNPVALKAATETMLAVIYVLVAWDMAVEPARLVGLWAVQFKHLFFWPFLDALPFNYAFLSTPVLHPDHADDVMPAFLAAIAKDKALPNTILARELDAAGREHSALQPLLRQHPAFTYRQVERPIATREFGIKHTGSTRKKLRQDWNRLAAEGNVEIENIRDPARIGAAFETFLSLEAASWKGAEHTAMLSKPRDADFARRLMGDLAQRGEASVALLKLNGKPIATQVLLYCGPTAYTWKTSFDEAFARFSAGTLLVDRIATDLIARGEADLIDSCARSEGFMGRLFAGRKPTVDLILSAAPRASAAFYALAAYYRLREAVKAWRDRPRGATAATGAQAAAEKPNSTTPAARRPALPEAPSRAPTTDRAA